MKLPSDYLHVLIYYIQNDKFLLKEIYERLPDCHKKNNGFFILLKILFREVSSNYELG